jgi:4a-hydroxytetrahydrobiopterin dehydratase
METLDEQQLIVAFSRLGGWILDGDVIEKPVEFADFAAAIAYVNQVAELAEAANHHPDILVTRWRFVVLRLTTHSAGGLSAADFALAEQINALIP